MNESSRPRKLLLSLSGCLIFINAMYFIGTVPLLYTSLICDDLQLNRAGFMIFNMIRGLAGVFVGLRMSRITGAIGVARTVAIGNGLTTVGFFLFASANGLPAFYLSGLCMGVGFGMAGTAVVAVFIGKTFTRNHHTIFGVVGASSSLAGVLLNPVLSGMVAESGWRAGLRCVAIMTVCTGLVSAVLLAVCYRENRAEHAEVGRRLALPAGPKSILIVSSLLVLINGLGIGTMYGNGPTVTISYGFPAVFVTGTLASLYSFTNLGGKIVQGKIGDRFGAKAEFYLLGTSFLLTVVCCLCMATGVTAVAATGMMLCGFIGSGSTVAIPLLVRAKLDECRDDAIYFLTAVQNLGMAFGGVAFQLGYSASAGYRASLLYQGALAVAYLVITRMLFPRAARVSVPKAGQNV